MQHYLIEILLVCKAKENAWFAIGIKVAVLLLATFGMASMGLAVFADVGVMVLAVLNAMRARQKGVLRDLFS